MRKILPIHGHKAQFLKSTLGEGSRQQLAPQVQSF